MRFLLIAACHLTLCIAFPMCTDGQTPLMEANDAFTCDRGCPLGFNCEFQDPYKTLSKAICCPNMTALQTLYGDEEHSEPIWDLSEVASLSLGLQAPSELPPLPETKEGVNAPAIRPPRKEKGSKSDQLEKESFNSIEPSNEETVNTEASPSGTDETTVVSETKFPTFSPEEESTTEDSVFSSTFGPDSDLTTEALPQEPITPGELEPSTIIPIEIEQTAETSSLEDTTTVSSATETEPPFTVEGSGDLSEDLAAGTSQKSCDRQKYRVFCHKGKLRTLATLRWSWNTDKGECEFYPWGYCPGDRIVESTTIRTKAECETLCGNQGSTAKFGSLVKPGVLARPQLNRGLKEGESKGVVARFEEDVRILPEKNSISADVSPAVATEANKESNIVRTIGVSSPVDSESTEESASAVLPVDLDSSPNTQSEVEVPKEIAEKAGNDQISETAKENVSSLEETNKLKEENLQTTGQEEELNDKTLIHAGSITSGAIQSRSEKSLTEVHVDKESSKVHVLESSHQGTESSDGIVAVPNEDKKGGVLCSSTSYRFACQSGFPSQFVYRWGMVDGKCQSFPYGYCYGEFNHGHPRTPEECSFYCSTPGQLFFAI